MMLSSPPSLSQVCGDKSAYLKEMAAAGIPSSQVPKHLGGTHPGLPLSAFIAAFAEHDQVETL